MTTENRQVILVASDEDIDHMIRVLDHRPKEIDFYKTDVMRRIINQLKAEQKRLFYPDNS